MMRAKATNSFDVDFFKLLSNSLFGKTIKQEDKRSKLKLVSDPVYLKKLSSKPTFGLSNMIHKGLVSITMKCPVLKLDKPSYIGYAILDLSRLFMSHFHYNFMLKKFSNSRLHLLYTDTDSLFYRIQSDDVYEELREHAKDIFDFSNYSSGHPNFDDSNKKVPGKFKDEMGGIPTKAFVGLRSKMYSFLLADGRVHMENKLGKGMPKSVMENHLTFVQYVRCLDKSLQLSQTFKAIRSVGHSMSTKELEKVNLSSFDDKRYLLNAVYSLPYGHYRLDRMPQPGNQQRKRIKRSENKIS